MASVTTSGTLVGYIFDVSNTVSGKIAAGVVVFSVLWEFWVRYKAEELDERDVKARQAMKEASPADAPPNPFLNLRAVNHYRRRYIWPGAVLVPLRLCGVVSVLLFAGSIGWVICATGDVRDKPLTGWRKTLLDTVGRFTARLMLFLVGFHYVEVRGKAATPAEAPVVVGNHRGPFEPLYLIASHDCCLVSAAENRWPIIRYGMDALQFIFVERAGKGRGQVVETIKRRATEGGWPQVALFPEGTTTNGKALIKFKAGAFIPGVPVQPVAFEFPNSEVDIDPSWVFGVKGPSMGLFTVTLRLMSSWSNPMRVTYLPVVHPTKEEKENPAVFAERVRRVIAAELKVPCTEHELEDALLATAAVKSKMDPEQAVVEFGKFKRLWNMTLVDARGLLEEFRKLDTDQDGEVTIEQFATLLGVPVDGTLLAGLFATMNNKSVTPRSTINFRQFLSGMAKASATMEGHEKSELCFDACDLSRDGKLTEAELGAVMKLGFSSVTKQQVHEIFCKMTGDPGKKYVTREQFTGFLKATPEYLLVFDMLRKVADVTVSGHEPESPLGLGNPRMSSRQSFIRHRKAFLDSKTFANTDRA